MPWPGFEPGLSRPQREVLTTIRSRPEIPLLWRQFLRCIFRQLAFWWNWQSSTDRLLLVYYILFSYLLNTCLSSVFVLCFVFCSFIVDVVVLVLPVLFYSFNDSLQKVQMQTMSEPFGTSDTRKSFERPIHVCEHSTRYSFPRTVQYIQEVTSAKTTPNVGLEPTTLRLRVSCSTDWASRALMEWEEDKV